MNGIEDIFDTLDRWRHLPAYQLERRADIFFSLYLAEVIEAHTGTAVAAESIPELPIKRDLIWSDRPTRQSVKVDYAFFAADRSKVFFVELKTDGSSRRAEQDEYLQRSREVGFRRIVDGIVGIVHATKAKQKYAHLLCALQEAGCLRLPDELLTYLYPKPRPGVTKCLRQVETTVATDEFEVVVLYVQPELGAGDVIDFEAFASVVGQHDDVLSQRFSRSLRGWRVTAGSVRP